ncbi:E3 ubiquitin-protein ligase RSL1-like [Wolffia australiana]
MELKNGYKYSSVTVFACLAASYELPAGFNPSSAMEVDQSDDLIEIQRGELMHASQQMSDMVLANRLQIEEAIVASLAVQKLKSKLLPFDEEPVHLEEEEDAIFGLEVQSKELERAIEEHRDAVFCQTEMQRISLELRRQAHDAKFARELALIPEDEWRNTGNFVQKPMETVSAEEEEHFRLYFKGLCEAMPGSAEYVTAVGVAICDPRGNQILKMQTPTIGPRVGGEIVEIRALIEGVNAAISLDLKTLDIFFQHTALFNHITGKWGVKQRNVSEALEEAVNALNKLKSHSMFLVPRQDIPFVFRLARDAVDSFLQKSTLHRVNAGVKENCPICLEDVDPEGIFQVIGCNHRFCFSCMCQHVEVKLLDGFLPCCPSEGCKTGLTVDEPLTYLTPKLAETLAQRLAEAAIPADEKVYCPYPRCSALMARGEARRLEGGSSSRGVAREDVGLRQCLVCKGLFCLVCRVPWHHGMSCEGYQWNSRQLHGEEARVEQLARAHMWRRCVKCSHMIELASGCFHVSCKCGYEFCYNCGAEWKKKKQTCRCPSWVEENILYGEQGRRR